MPWPDFSELSFGYGFLREFERDHTPGGSVPAAPDFITQSAEATAGYDVSMLHNSVPVFFQFKRSFVLTTRNAKEIRDGDFTDPTLYRMHLRSKDSYRQHRALQNLESAGNSVFYVTSQVSDPIQLTRNYIDGTVVSQAAALFAPNEILLPTLDEPHHLCFKADESYAYLYSDEGRRQERKFRSWSAVKEELASRRTSASQNRKDLANFVESLTSSNRAARTIASRFKDDVVRASVLAFLQLDLQMTFLK